MATAAGIRNGPGAGAVERAPAVVARWRHREIGRATLRAFAGHSSRRRRADVGTLRRASPTPGADVYRGARSALQREVGARTRGRARAVVAFGNRARSQPDEGIFRAAGGRQP